MTSEALKERTTARRVLAVLIGLLATLLGLQVLASLQPGGYTAFAQDPSPGGRAIKIINPDSTTSTEISNKNDGTDSAYHLVAWVNNPQTGDAVEFTYTPDDSTVEINIQCLETGTARARPVGSDTFECHWNLNNVPEGEESGTLRAILFTNNTAGPTDEEAVTIDREGQTVEITYPVNGGEIGFYTAPDGTTSGAIDFSTSAAGTPEGDEGTQDVVAYYSVAPPGSEPDFIQCDNDPHETEPGSNDSARCTLIADDPDTAANEGNPEQVTAVALVARDIDEGEVLEDMCPESPNPGPPLCDIPDPDSADAHRAMGYNQNPTTVTLDPQTQQATPGACSQVITATVRDQNERKIVGANVDVHGQGPTDNLFFDDADADDNTSEHQPPENGHTTEGTIDCESEESPRPFNNDSLQGKHDELTPTPDIKHIESLPEEGTDDDGAFRFRLYTADSGGPGTQFTAWADEDGNDRFCSEEAHGNGSIGWGTAAPSVTGVAAEDTSCPGVNGTPSPTPTETSTASPTPTDTGTPTPDPTETGGGDVVQRGPCQGHREGSNTARPGGGRVIVGTSGRDEIRGSPGDDLICGLGERDSIRGRDGDDEIYGGRGNDDIRGNQGDDTLVGARGIDIIRGGAGSDVARGGAFDDTIRGFDGRDRLVGGSGNDTLRAGRGRDFLKGKTGDDIVDGGPGRDRCRPGRGDDRVIRCEGR